MAKRRYEVRSASGTCWWSTDSLADAYHVLDESGTNLDHVFDLKTNKIPKRGVMNANGYQKRAHEFADYGDANYPYFGLAEEAGEVMGKIAKFIRHTKGLSPHDPFVKDTQELAEYKEAIKAELSDVLWMVAEIATLNGLTLEEIMDYNIDKLNDRKKRGVIDGSGDTLEERLRNAKRD